ncbi:hypothetical protein [uncultured Tateyamaria sp.]|uniref:hypothetical protein n=1 Tax=uncultured Tateyamaria sp. TaxID=455651 RepID=UPI0026145B1D|nr:hypothetical protein [uncultured Tateyamaria sp.]
MNQSASWPFAYSQSTFDKPLGIARAPIDLSNADEQVDQAPFAIVLEPMGHHDSSVADGVQFGVHPALRAISQTAKSPFVALGLDTVR